MTDAEERLKLLRALGSNPGWIEILKEAVILQEVKEREYKERGFEYYGFEWFEVHAPPQTLHKMVTEKILDVPLSTRSGTHFRVRNRSLIQEAIEFLASPEVLPEEVIPEDLFSPIVGHDNIKALMRYALESPSTIGILLTGQPASSKTLFLMELRRLPNSLYCLAQTLTGAGLADLLFLKEPKVILIDEIDRLNPENVGVLNSLLQSGILSETKFGKTRQIELKAKVFAAGIRVQRLPADLLSRFIKFKFNPYTVEEFISICSSILPKEGCDEPTSRFIALEIWRMNQESSDIRTCVQVARLASGHRDRVEEIIRALKRYRV